MSSNWGIKPVKLGGAGGIWVKEHELCQWQETPAGADHKSSRRERTSHT